LAAFCGRVGRIFRKGGGAVVIKITVDGKVIFVAKPEKKKKKKYKCLVRVD